MFKEGLIMIKRPAIYLFLISLFLIPSQSFGLNGAKLGDMYAVLDIGQYIRIQNTGPIHLEADENSPDPFNTFKGCRKFDVDCNFNAQLRAQTKAVSKAGGEWQAKITPTILSSGSTEIEVCVAGTNVKTYELMGGQKNVPVAEITIQVIAL